MMDGLVAEKLCNAVADSCNVFGAWHLWVANAPSSWVSSFWCARVLPGPGLPMLASRRTSHATSSLVVQNPGRASL